MKVLWFSNTPCSAVEKLKKENIYGGWLSSLEKEINNLPNIELGICFYSYTQLTPFHHEGTQYFPVYRKKKSTKFKRFISKLLSKNYDSKEIEKLLEVIQEFSPDIIHVHGTEENFGLIQEFIKTPVVISIQGLLNPIEFKFFAGIPKSISYRYEKIANKMIGAGIRQNFFSFKNNSRREIKILNMTKYLIGRTSWDYNVTRILAPFSTYYKNNEILRPAYYSSKWDIKQNNSNIHLVTTMSDGLYKGFETIVDTANILKTYSKLDFVWRVIGINNNSNTVRLVKKWKRLDLNKIGIELLGLLPTDSIVEKLLSSNLYIQVSHIENSPNSLCEAQILGVPAVATFAGGTSSLVNEKTGILIQEGDPWSLAGAIVSLIKDSEQMKYLSENSRKEATKRHNKSEIVDELLITYQSIIEKNERCNL